MKTKRGAPKGNQRAKKAITKDRVVTFRPTPNDLSKWEQKQKALGFERITDFIVHACNKLEV